MVTNEESQNVFVEDEVSRQSVQSFETQAPLMTQFLIRYSGGLIKDEKRAVYVLVFIVFIATLASLFLFSSGGSSRGKKGTLPLPTTPQFSPYEE